MKNKIVDPKVDYTPRKAVYKNEEQFTRDVRATVHKLADMMTTGREKGLIINFGISLVGEHFVPQTDIMRKL